MSVSAVSSNAFPNYSSQANYQQMRQAFQKLGQDLSSGNLSAAQSDYATLQSDAPQGSSTSSTTGSSLQQEFSQLSQDLQSGNLSGAQQDFTTIQQSLQSKFSSAQGGSEKDGNGHVHRHHHGDSEASQVQQLMSQLGTALQSGNLSSAQSVYASLQSDFQQAYGDSAGSTSASNTSSNLAVSY